MVVGDVVNIIGAFSGSYFYYQPAASTEVCITWQPSEQNYEISLTNGTNSSVVNVTKTQTALSNKIFLTNAIYLKNYSIGTYAGLSGIQIK